jgi:CheY-like chemotaxis protein
MRKRRVILIDDDPVMLDILKQFFELLGYEVMACRATECCPEYNGQNGCDPMRACGDILITDYHMPGMSGLALLQKQMKMGCRLTMQNKAVVSGYLDAAAKEALDAMGCAHFNKPFTFDMLGKWVNECEQRMDLTMPLGFKRKELRQSCSFDMTFQLERGESLCRAEVVNRSGSGLCVRASQPLAVDQILDLRADMPFSSGRLMVRWMRSAGDGVYFAGMSCC